MMRRACLLLAFIPSLAFAAGPTQAVRTKVKQQIMTNAKSAIGPGIARLNVRAKFSGPAAKQKVAAELWGKVALGVRPRPGIPPLLRNMRQYSASFSVKTAGSKVTVRRTTAWKQDPLPM